MNKLDKIQSKKTFARQRTPPVIAFRVIGVVILLLGVFTISTNFNRHTLDIVLGVVAILIGFFGMRARLIALIFYPMFGAYTLFGFIMLDFEGHSKTSVLTTEPGQLILLFISLLTFLATYQGYKYRESLKWI